MDSGNVLRNMQFCGETNSHTQISQAGLRKHLKNVLIIKAPSQNERLFHLLRMLGMLGPGASSSHQIQQEPWEVKGSQFPSDLPAFPQEQSLDLTTMCTIFLLVCFSHNSQGMYPAGEGAHFSSSQSQQEQTWKTI